jgi:hypothetical protein
MRLAVTVSLPVVSLAALSLATWASLAPEPAEPMTPDVTIESVESVMQREQVRMRREARPHHSVWRGIYECAQGLSAMTLRIDVAPGGVAIARYDFGPVESNPTVPHGAFLLAGSFEPNADGGFAAELVATEWIVHPDNYFMVPLSIRSPDGKRLSGKSHHATCKPFTITRVE